MEKDIDTSIDFDISKETKELIEIKNRYIRLEETLYYLVQEGTLSLSQHLILLNKARELFGIKTHGDIC